MCFFVSVTSFYAPQKESHSAVWSQPGLLNFDSALDEMVYVFESSAADGLNLASTNTQVAVEQEVRG